MNKKWVIREEIPAAARNHLARWDAEPLIQQLFWNRGLENEEQALAFVRRENSFDDDPFQLTSMDAAIERILAGLDADESIVVYGDYDVDGVTATRLMVEVLEAFGANVSSYVPRRDSEGYGLHSSVLENMKKEGVSLVLTVDCGVRAVEQAAYARSLGMDLIISDHHYVGEVLPDAVAVINPKRPDSHYPEHMLSGVGIANKISDALLRRRSPVQAEILPRSFLDLVALGTVADLAPLCGENRTLVYSGLEQLNSVPRPGIMALMQAAGSKGPVTARTIGFQLGPRLNAAGRMGSVLDALQLLATRNTEEATQLAQGLEELNRERQNLTKKISERALEMAHAQVGDEDPKIFFAAHAEFHSGIVGLAASRLCEEFHRPALVAQRKDGMITGSARSVEHFHISEALLQCADLLDRHGGHAVAAGFTLPEENWKQLKGRLREIAIGQLSGKDLRPTLSIDAVVESSQLTQRLAEQLEYFEPSGNGNPTPVFVWRGAPVLGKRVVGKNGDHLKLKTRTENGLEIDVIGFWLGDRLPTLSATADLAFSFENNEWRGRKRQQLNLKDVSAST